MPQFLPGLNATSCCLVGLRRHENLEGIFFFNLFCYLISSFYNIFFCNTLASVCISIQQVKKNNSQDILEIEREDFLRGFYMHGLPAEPCFVCRLPGCPGAWDARAGVTNACNQGARSGLEPKQT